ncbi:glycosyltransferase, partial [Thermococcus sp. MV5]
PLLTTKLKYTHGLFKEYHNYIPIQRKPEDIANKLELIYLNPKVRKKLATTVKNIKEKLKSLEWEHIAEQHVKVYYNLVSLIKHK